jgi:hypothetical protein
MKKSIKSIVSLTLVLVTVISCLIIPASAASNSLKITPSSNGTTKTQTFQVTTKANYWLPGSSSVTLSQSKGTISYSKTNFWGKITGSAKTTSYGTWNIVAKSTDGKDTVNKTLTGSSVTINLKPNKTYNVTVSYNGAVDTVILMKHTNSQWTTYPSWQLKSTWKVSSYW